MMPLSNSVEDSTKTEDKDQHIAAQSADGSLQSAFDQHDEIQTFRHASNKEVPLSCGLEDPFHASLSSIMKGGELSSQHWSPHLSPFHTSETLCSEATQAFDNVSRLSTVDEFTFDSGLLFRGRKETDSRLLRRSASDRHTSTETCLQRTSRTINRMIMSVQFENRALLLN
ncbi:hypothetical protein CISG_01742 [Coccidioides immitis RMSCC 3703]|uniref:Uncharacterized protein n=1 Tax=Coccidioides immitis RMSCC 3703 TaxID=454286 RepID=A0A0J8TXL3_COCIT|nr:hypothetical protein CISG_01742 [Coccidioides immitis RMSCC 3703]